MNYTHGNNIGGSVPFSHFGHFQTMSVNLCVQKRYLVERENKGAEAKIELHSPLSHKPKPLLSH